MSPSHRSFAAWPGRWIPHDGFPTSAWYESGASASLRTMSPLSGCISRARDSWCRMPPRKPGRLRRTKSARPRRSRTASCLSARPLDGVTVFVRDEAGRQMPDEAERRAGRPQCIPLPRILAAARADRTGVPDVERHGRDRRARLSHWRSWPNPQRPYRASRACRPQDSNRRGCGSSSRE